MTGFPKKVRDIIFERANDHCEVCGQDRPQQLHHRRPRGHGGTKRPETNYPSNGLAVSTHCHHTIVEANPELARDRGWKVPQYLNPADVPVLRHGSEWVLLRDDGLVFQPPQGKGRCERCGFHVKSQGHRQGCQLFGQGAA